jgi:hypothetical protein
VGQRTVISSTLPSPGASAQGDDGLHAGCVPVNLYRRTPMPQASRYIIILITYKGIKLKLKNLIHITNMVRYNIIFYLKQFGFKWPVFKNDKIKLIKIRIHFE